MCSDSDIFREMCDEKRGVLNLANNFTTAINGTGTSQFTALTFGAKRNISPVNTAYVPDLRTNLLSVDKIIDSGFEVTFRKDRAEIVYKDGNVALRADRIADLYYIQEQKDDASPMAIHPRSKVQSNDLWHRCFGPANMRDVSDVVRKNFMMGIRLENSDSILDCNVCLRGKMSRTPFPKKSFRKTETLDLIHTDVCGPIQVESLGRARYYVEFIDDNSRWCDVRFLKTKAEVFQATKEYIALVENPKGRTVKSLQSDNDGEYTPATNSKSICKRKELLEDPQHHTTQRRTGRPRERIAPYWTARDVYWQKQICRKDFGLRS